MSNLVDPGCFCGGMLNINGCTQECEEAHSEYLIKKREAEEIQPSGPIPKADCLDAANNLIADLNKKVKSANEACDSWRKYSDRNEIRFVNAVFTSIVLVMVLLLTIVVYLSERATSKSFERAFRSQVIENTYLKNVIYELKNKINPD